MFQTTNQFLLKGWSWSDNSWASQKSRWQKRVHCRRPARCCFSASHGNQGSKKMKDSKIFSFSREASHRDVQNILNICLWPACNQLESLMFDGIKAQPPSKTCPESQQLPPWPCCRASQPAAQILQRPVWQSLRPRPQRKFEAWHWVAEAAEAAELSSQKVSITTCSQIFMVIVIGIYPQIHPNNAVLVPFFSNFTQKQAETLMQPWWNH